MEIPEYKSNSHKSKEQNTDIVEREKVEKVVSGTVKTKKRAVSVNSLETLSQKKEQISRHILLKRL